MALLGAITTPLQPLISLATTSLDAWTTLASTFGRPSRGHLKQIKEQLKKSTKGQRSIDDYLQAMKAKADHLALLGKPLDHEDIIEYILDGLDDDYRAIVDQINGRDVPPTLDELRDKLVNREAALLCSQPTAPSFPATANYAAPRSRGSSRPQASSPSSRYAHHSRSPRPYLGRCQACGTQGHSVRSCHLFRMISVSPSVPAQPMPWQPRAHISNLSSPDSASWLLDSGASHHITSDLNNLHLTSPFHGSEAVTLGDGSSHAITHTGSFPLSSSHRPLTLHNVLRVPNVGKNLISVRQLCADNNVDVVFDPVSFQVKDLHTGAL